MSVDLLPFPSDTRIKPSNWSRSPSSLASLPEIFGKVNKPEPSNQFLVSRVIIQITSPREKISVSRDKIVVSWSLAKNILLKEEPSSRICKRYRSDSEKERERDWNWTVVTEGFSYKSGCNVDANAWIHSRPGSTFPIYCKNGVEAAEPPSPSG